MADRVEIKACDREVDRHFEQEHAEKQQIRAYERVAFRDECSDNHTLLICSTCLGSTAASNLRATLADDLPAGYSIRAVDCMAGCDHPVTVGFQAPGKATYLFGGIKSAADIAGILAFTHQYQQSKTGWTSASDRPAALYEKTLARVPALPGVTGR
ncbi:MAG: DUF1636 domain-containing protein [Pseudomonadota bacterium]